MTRWEVCAYPLVEELPACLRAAAARRALRRFLREWDAIRPALRLPLTNRPLQPPLAPLVGTATAAAAAYGQTVSSTDRFSTMDRFLHDTAVPASLTVDASLDVEEMALTNLPVGASRDVEDIDDDAMWHAADAWPEGAAAAAAAEDDDDDGEEEDGGGAGAGGSAPASASAAAAEAAADSSLVVAPVEGAQLEEWTAASGKLWRQWLAPASALSGGGSGGGGGGGNMVPLCLACRAPYDDAARARYGHPFCSEPCLRRYRVRVAPGAVGAQTPTKP